MKTQLNNHPHYGTHAPRPFRRVFALLLGAALSFSSVACVTNPAYRDFGLYLPTPTVSLDDSETTSDRVMTAKTALPDSERQ